MPITLVMVLVGVLRHNVTQLLDSTPKKSNLKAIREQSVPVNNFPLSLIPIPPFTHFPPSSLYPFSKTYFGRRILMRSQILRSNRAHISPSSFLTRRGFLLEALANGQYLQVQQDDLKDGKESSGPKNPLTDPGAMDGMMDQMKKSMVMMVPQTVIMGWINFFFSGFILSE